MTITNKLLGQIQLTTTPSAVATAPAGGQNHVVEIFVANDATADRTVRLYANGSAGVNLLFPGILVATKKAYLLDGLKIYLNDGEILYASVDTGSAEVTVTAYGKETTV